MSDETEATPEPREIGKYREKIVSGPIIRTLVWLGAPPLVNQLVVVTYNVADTYWISNYSEIAVAVPRQMWPVLMLFQALVMALTAACLSIVSQYVGGEAYKKASLEASRFFTVSFLAGITLSLLLFASRSLIFTWLMYTPAEVFEDVMNYSGIMAFDVFFTYIVLTYTTLLQSVGDTKRPAIVNAIAVGINVALDPFFVLGIGPFPRLGVVGAALTDVIGKIISISALTYILKRNYPELRIKFTKDIDTEWARLVLHIGLPILTLGLLNGFAFLAQLRLVNMLGVIVAAAFSIGFVILDIVDTALWGLGGAPAIMVGQSLGARKPKRAREVAYKAAVLIFALMMIAACLIYPIRRNVADIFADNPQILDESDMLLQFLLPTLPFFGLYIVAMSTGRGSGHTSFPTTIGILRLWGIRIGLGYFLALTLGIGPIGVWLAISLSNVVGGIIAILWIRYGKWAEAIVKSEGS
ncbi:MAG: MATE family efflux transporter [Candidatus Bathycorpusculaceae bacterium]